MSILFTGAAKQHLGESVLVGTCWLCVPGLTPNQLAFKSGSKAGLFGPGVRGWGTHSSTNRPLPAWACDVLRVTSFRARPSLCLLS